MLSHLPRGRPFIDNYVFPDDMRGWTDIPPGIWALSNDYDAAARPVGPLDDSPGRNPGFPRAKPRVPEGETPGCPDECPGRTRVPDDAPAPIIDH